MEGAFDMQTVKCELFKTQIPDIDLITDDYSSKSNGPVTYN